MSLTLIAGFNMYTSKNLTPKVGLEGFEPITSCMQHKCAPVNTIGPNGAGTGSNGLEISYFSLPHGFSLNTAKHTTASMSCQWPLMTCETTRWITTSKWRYGDSNPEFLRAKQVCYHYYYIPKNTLPGPCSPIAG